MSSNNNNKQQQQQQASHINPFYIDPGERLELEWEGDDEWDDEYEAEGLINNNCVVAANSNQRQSSSAAAAAKKKAAASFGNNKRQLPHVKGVRLSRGQKRWMCIVGFFVLVIFFILSSTSKNSSNNHYDDYNIHNNNNGNDASGAETDYVPKDKSNDENGASTAMNDDDTSNSVDEDSSKASTSSASKKPPPSSPLPGGNSEQQASSLSNVHRVVLLGERQTGVDAFQTHWSTCFPTRNFTTTLTRKTTWFQDLSQPAPSLSLAPHERILFVLLVRNPYTWVEAMRGHPMHMSAHVNQTDTHRQALSWKDFVDRPWMPLTSDIETDTTEAANTLCQLGFAPNQVVPCHIPDSADRDDAHPPDIYELKPASTGGTTTDMDMKSLAFASILELRAAKLRHFVYDLPRAYQGFDLMATPLTPTSTVSSSLIDNNVLIIHYEDDLVQSMQKLEQVTGWSPVHHCRQAKRLPPSVVMENLDPDYIQFLSQTQWLDWELEAQLGYQKVL
jgi:hypothetical protein